MRSSVSEGLLRVRLRASGNMLTAMAIAVVSQWMVRFPPAYVLSKRTSLVDLAL
jgi:Na+-driven multidrug efflux pump